MMHALALSFAIGASAQAPAPVPPTAPKPGAATTAAPASETRITTQSGLVYTIVSAGTGALAAAGQTVMIHETLTLPDGRLIFTSKGKPLVKFLLGGQQVIPGVEGVTGMRVGERRTLVVSPALDGRSFDPAFIPPDVNRHYDIELVEIVNDGQP